MGRKIRIFARLNKCYGKGRWRKLKGIANIQLSGKIHSAELHWYESHGLGKKEIKIKKLIESVFDYEK